MDKSRLEMRPKSQICCFVAETDNSFGTCYIKAAVHRDVLLYCLGTANLSHIMQSHIPEDCIHNVCWWENVLSYLGYFSFRVYMECLYVMLLLCFPCTSICIDVIVQV